MYQFEPKYKIGQNIWHITPESDKGIIVDISYKARTKEIMYNVIFGRGPDDDLWCHEFELIDSKQFV
jgi:uncharacterized protein (UPF0303 family)